MRLVFLVLAAVAALFTTYGQVYNQEATISSNTAQHNDPGLNCTAPPVLCCTSSMIA